MTTNVALGDANNAAACATAVGVAYVIDGRGYIFDASGAHRFVRMLPIINIHLASLHAVIVFGSMQRSSRSKPGEKNRFRNWRNHVQKKINAYLFSALPVR